MSLARFAEHGLSAIDDVQSGKNEQVEYTASENIAHRDVGNLRHGHRANPGCQLGQRRHRGQKNDAHPGTAQSGLLSDGVAVVGKLDPGDTDHDQT